MINNSIRQAFIEYIKAYPGVEDKPEHYIFFNTKTNAYTEPIKRGQAWKFIHSICQEVGLQGNYGTHSLRKTWGYHARMQWVDLALIMHKLNHERIAYTKRYLGITDDELQAAVQREELQLGVRLTVVSWTAGENILNFNPGLSHRQRLSLLAQVPRSAHPIYYELANLPRRVRAAGSFTTRMMRGLFIESGRRFRVLC